MRREPRWVKVFLKHLARSGNVRLAAEGAGVDYTTAYQRRRRYAKFAEAWEGALRLHAARSAQDEPNLPSPLTPLTPDQVRCESPSPAWGEGQVVRPDGKVIKGSEARWGKRAEERFLSELTTSANVRLAARAAGFSTVAVYKRRLKDKHFAAAWDAAVDSGRARVQAYLLEAATRTFDPDELPIADDREMPKVSIGEAINIAKLPARQAGGAAGGGFSPGGKGLEDRIYDETGFDVTPISREEWEGAKERIAERLRRMAERMEEEERETGRCRTCGQALAERVEE